MTEVYFLLQTNKLFNLYLRIRLNNKNSWICWMLKSRIINVSFRKCVFNKEVNVSFRNGCQVRKTHDDNFHWEVLQHVGIFKWKCEKRVFTLQMAGQFVQVFNQLTISSKFVPTFQTISGDGNYEEFYFQSHFHFRCGTRRLRLVICKDF